MIMYVSKNRMKQIKPDKKIAVISIVEPSEDYIPSNEWENLIQVKFDDIKKEVKHYVLFNNFHAKLIIDFIETTKNKVGGYIVHCHAGVSRSGAVAHFIANVLGEKYVHNDHSYEETEYVPYINKHVLNTLIQEYNRKDF